MTKTKVIGLSIIITLLLITVVLMCGSKASRIPDAKRRWQKDYSDRVSSLLHGGLAIHIEGSLDGKAVLHTPDGEIELSTGRINKMLIEHEDWISTCRITYEPIDVRSGTLTVQVAIGRLPYWAQRPILDTEPVNYVGQWTTWYPDRMRVYSKGFYFRGQKNGHWYYWEKDSSILREEEWDYGRLITNSAKNADHPAQ